MAKIYGNLTIETWERGQELFGRGLKQCGACDEIKPLDEFYNDKSKMDGKTSKCIECHKEYAHRPEVRTRERARQRSPAGRAYQRQWYRDNPDKVKAGKRRYLQSERGRETDLTYSAKYRQRNRERQRAHYAVNDAIRYHGFPTIKTQKCQECGEQATCYHHEGYKRECRLDVVPLCSRCHHLYHQRDQGL